MNTAVIKMDREVVSPQEWEAAREQLLVKEKALTRARDALAAERRRMPWLAVEKDYEFDGPEGKASLFDLFDGRRQLIVYRAFFEPGVKGWPEHACVGCSMVADQVAHPAHLNTRDTTLAFASRAPQKDIERLKARMGWQFIPWYTITDGFDKDFGVDEWHGTNAFIRDGDGVFRTYFIDNRGDEQMGNTWNYLDITALGRQEEWENSPEGYPQTPTYEWWIWHDEPNKTEADRPGLVQLRAYSGLLERRRRHVRNRGNQTKEKQNETEDSPIAKAEMLIRKPVAEVFEAFVNPAITSKFWFSKGGGRLEAGKEVTWDWEMYHFSVSVKVKAVEQNARILVEWPAYGAPTLIEWIFKRASRWHDIRQRDKSIYFS